MRNDFSAAACVKGGRDAPMLSGVVRFVQKRDGVLVEVNVSGLPKSNHTGFFALHIHEGDSCSGKDFSGTKGHFNPEDRPHPNHAGDLPPLLSYSGNAYMKVMTNRFRVSDIIGRTVVIHSNPDDFYSQPSGDSGGKIACGVIRRTGNTRRTGNAGGKSHTDFLS